PVLVGGGQTIDRPEDPTAGREPLLLMEEAAQRAAEDAGGGARLLAAVDTVTVPTVVCHDYGDAAGLLAERLGCPGARRLNTTLGGNTPQALVNHLADEIAARRIAVALIAGAEAWHTARALGRAGRRIPWTPPRPEDAPRWGDGRPGSSELEIRHGAAQPITTYPLFENAFRAARGLGLAAHRRELADFAAHSAALAARNPHAWLRHRKSAGAALLESAGLTIDRLAHLDRYSCFPIAPRLTAAMLGIPLDDPRPLTVTGGLPWFGGPGNNYATHAIVALVERLRAARDAFGLVHANGWHLTKHALGIYGGAPSP